MELNANQTRALWATALRNLADAIDKGHTLCPTSANLWSQYVSPTELLWIADHTYTEPLPITMHFDTGHAGVRVPTGELLGLNIDWAFHVKLPTDPVERTKTVNQFSDHNQQCVPVPYSVSEPASASDE